MFCDIVSAESNNPSVFLKLLSVLLFFNQVKRVVPVLFAILYGMLLIPICSYHLCLTAGRNLHDDGVLYAKLLQEAGIEAELHESSGTMHGFDTVFNAPTTQKMIALRVAYMKRLFAQ